MSPCSTAANVVPLDVFRKDIASEVCFLLEEKLGRIEVLLFEMKENLSRIAEQKEDDPILSKLRSSLKELIQ